MIGWEDVYKVVAAMAPLYFALALGYGSVKWWHIFTREQCATINRLVSYFTIPFFTLEFTSNINPFALNYRFIAADAISKAISIGVIAIWCKCSSNGSFSWSITNFAMCNLSNSLVMGVPILRAMYGAVGADIVVQSAIVQIMIWMKLLILVLEFNRLMGDSSSNSTNKSSAASIELGGDCECDLTVEKRPSFWSMMVTVWVKLAIHPNTYPCVVGITWALISNRWHLKMPTILQGCIEILSKSGSGTSMFSLGLFMALQEKMVACGTKLTVMGMVLRFIAGPAAMVIGALSMRLRGDVLRIAIIQAALPQSVASFVWAKEYGLHAHVLSTAVIVGTVLSLPILVAYYGIADLIK